GLARPGAISRAHAGVLFLDEAPEFPARVLDALREPLETGDITLHRTRGVTRYPARFQLVLASNPCPCGKAWGKGEACTCTPQQRRRYRARLSGPVLDRVDMRVDVAPVDLHRVEGAAGEPSAAIAARAGAARERKRRRYEGRAWALNSQLPRLVRRARCRRGIPGRPPPGHDRAAAGDGPRGPAPAHGPQARNADGPCRVRDRALDEASRARRRRRGSAGRPPWRHPRPDPARPG